MGARLREHRHKIALFEKQTYHGVVPDAMLPPHYIVCKAPRDRCPSSRARSDCDARYSSGNALSN